MTDTAPVRPGEELNVEALRAFLRGRLDGELAVEQFPGGHSNLTYLLRVDGREFVLRRAPMGPVAPKAHDMVREFRVLEKLHPVYRFAPKPEVLCEDASVLGVPFYLMERRRGVILRRDVPQAYAARGDFPRRASEALVDGLADLHAVDIFGTNLVGIGRPEGFLTRQVEGWAERWSRAKVEDVPDMERALTYLRSAMPEPQAATLVHNDYKLDNVMLSEDDPGRLVAVLDWEMTTVGDPLVDLGLSLCYWQQPTEPFGAFGRGGWFSRDEFVARYAERTGFDVSRVTWYEVLGAFKLAVILQQIFYRYHVGQTRDPRFAKLDRQVKAIAGMAAARMEA